jgi:hypothetical protein
MTFSKELGKHSTSCVASPFVSSPFYACCCLCFNIEPDKALVVVLSKALYRSPALYYFLFTRELFSRHVSRCLMIQQETVVVENEV